MKFCDAHEDCSACPLYLQCLGSTALPMPAQDIPVPADTAKVPGAKNDDGKLDISTVPPEIITAVAEIRRYGNTKYADPENWRRVEPAKFHKAMLRHILACWQDPFAIDPESGMPHLWHVCCNAAFLCHFYNKEEKTNA